MSGRATILTFHSIDGSGSPVSTSPAEFERLLAHLRGRGYRSLPLRDAVHRLRAGAPLPGQGLVITFDDGYLNNLTGAAPILERYGFTATVFVATGFIGKTNAWPDQHPSIPGLPMMSWDEVRAARDAGIDIGAHTHNHPRLSRVGAAAAEEEMVRSKREIEDRLGAAVPLFSYPFGDLDATVRHLARRHFEGAVGNRPGRLRPGIDLYALDRINACGNLFRRLPLPIRTASGFGMYLALKQAVDRLRRPRPSAR